MLKHVLNVLGLSCDLIGAVLLSVPMIWDTRQIAQGIVRRLRTFNLALFGPARPRTATVETTALRLARGRLLVMAATLAALFMMTAARLILIQFGYRHNFARGPDDWFEILLRVYALGGLILVSALMLMTPFTAAKALLWVAHGKRERKIGFVGLATLCVGFILQAWVNFL